MKCRLAFVLGGATAVVFATGLVWVVLAQPMNHRGYPNPPVPILKTVNSQPEGSIRPPFLSKVSLSEPQLPEVLVQDHCLGLLLGTVLGGTGVGEVLSRPWPAQDPQLAAWNAAVEAAGGRKRAEEAIAGLPGRVAGLCALSQNQVIIVYVVGEQEYVALKNGERLTVIPGARAFNATATGADVFPCNVATVAGQQVWQCFTGLSGGEGAVESTYKDWEITP